MNPEPAWRPLLRALIETVLAFDDPDFPPMTVERVEGRVLERFPLEDEERSKGLHLALRSFGEMSAFSIVPPVILRVEQELLVSEGLAGADLARLVAEKIRVEVERFAAFAGQFGPAARFERATLATRRAYLRLWARSGFAQRRRVYTTLKGLVLLAAYSLPELARAVEGAGR
jgi:hypothetical protein